MVGAPAACLGLYLDHCPHSTPFSGSAPRAVLRSTLTWIHQLSLISSRLWRPKNGSTLLYLRAGKDRCSFCCPALTSFGNSQRPRWAPAPDGRVTVARSQRPDDAVYVSRKRRVAPSSATAVSLPEAWAVVSTHMLWRLFTGFSMFAWPCTSTALLTGVAG